jgi:hypothetical protein
MQSRDYLKKQFEQISNAIAKSLANMLKVKFDTDEERQQTVDSLDNDVLRIINLSDSEFTEQLEKLPVDALQNLSLLLFEVGSTNRQQQENQKKINAINSLLAQKHKTLDFNSYLRNNPL